MQKMTCNYPKVDLAKMNADIKFGETLDHNSGTNVQNMTCNNQKLDHVNMNAYIKFGEKISVSSQGIERKRNFGVNQGP